MDQQLASSSDVVFIKNTPAPYRIPLLNQLAAMPDYDLSVLFITESKEHREWSVNPEEFEFEYQVHGWHPFCKSVAAYLLANRPDAILIGGYDTLAAWIGAVYGTLTRTPYIPVVGTWEESIVRDGGVADVLRSCFIKSGSACVAYGSKSKRLLSSYGIKECQLFSAINTVDVETFAEQSRSVKEEESNDVFKVLYCGQLISRKNVGTLIQAVEIADADIQLTIVGEGDLRPELEADAAVLDNEVQFTGFVPREELHKYYVSADLLVLPSLREVWGLVVNEALACGTPAIVSIKCGCTADVIRDGFNGERFDPQDTGELARLLSQYATGVESFASSEEIQQDAISRLSIENEVVAFDAAIRAVLDKYRTFR